MEIKRGIPASPGVAIAEAYILDTEDYPVTPRHISSEDVEFEIQRFDRARESAVEEVRAIQNKAAKTVSGGYLKIFDFHIEMLKDGKLREEVCQLIRQEHASPEYALSRVFRKLMKIFNDNEFLKHRVADLLDVQKHLRKHLGGRAGELTLPRRKTIVVSHDMTPAQTVALNRQLVAGFATDAGGRTSHAAIISRALGIPAVVGLQNITSEIVGGDLVIVDGNRGWVIISPDEATLQSYRQKELVLREEKERLLSLRELPAETKDGFRVRLMANIEFPEEVGTALENGAEGVGLYRTEYLYTQTRRPPTEEEHYEAYCKAGDELGDLPLTIRTLDLGADKFYSELGWEREDNPFLGCRSIRFCLERRELFRTQIRAILRAAKRANVHILLPMITTREELRTANVLLSEVQEELGREGIEFPREIPVGIMIEVPSAAWTADILSKNCDFFSIGTNDLIQYCLAVDRANERVASLYQPAHPAVLRLINHILRVGKEQNIPVAMCGEMSGDPLFTILLIGLGLREFSVTPGAIPELKRLIRAISYREAKDVARTALKLESHEEAMNFLAERTKKFAPEFVTQ